MKKDKDTSVDAAELRRMAEEKLKATSAEAHPPIREPDAQRLVHELQVHQIELELQNEELRQARDDAAAWLEWYTDLYDFAPVGYFTLDRQGDIRQVNLTGSSLLGVERSRLVNRRFGLFVSPETLPTFNACLQSVFESQTKQICEMVLLTEAGAPIYARIEAAVSRVGEECRVAVIDITEHKLVEHRQQLSTEILSILNEPVALADAIDRVLTVIKREMGFDAVGLRLQSGEDFPYFAQNGFSDDFLLAENTLAVPAPEGGVCRDKDGNICLECTCGLVISGQTDPTNPLFTPGGSCWTNNSLPLLDIPADQEPRLHPRNRCVHEGFLSVAIIPIRANQNIVGLLQLNDRKKDRLTGEMIRYFEGISANIGLALMKKQAEEALARSNEQVTRILQSISDAFMALDRNWRFTYVNNEAERVLLKSREELVGTSIWDQFPEAVGTVFQTEYERAMLEETAVQFESYYPPFDQWFEVRAYPYEGGLSVYFRDCTERRAAQESLAQVAEREHHIAELLQEALIPRVEYEVPGWKIAVRYQPALEEARVGGDFYDVFDLGDEKIGILIGDVAGKGLRAAMRVAAVRHSVRSYAYLDPNPATVMALTNQAIIRDYPEGDALMTAFFAVLGIREGAMRYTNAGHEPPILLTSAGDPQEIGVYDPALGFLQDAAYSETCLSIGAGDAVVMITDGVTEARRAGGELFGKDRVVAWLREHPQTTPDEIADGLLEAARSHAGGELRDDAAVLIFSAESGGIAE